VAGVGTVVGGTVMQGVVTSGQTVLLGPDSNGAFQQGTILAASLFLSFFSCFYFFFCY
jgi:GTPase